MTSFTTFCNQFFFDLFEVIVKPTRQMRTDKDVLEALLEQYKHAGARRIINSSLSEDNIDRMRHLPEFSDVCDAILPLLSNPGDVDYVNKYLAKTLQKTTRLEEVSNEMFEWFFEHSRTTYRKSVAKELYLDMLLNTVFVDNLVYFLEENGCLDTDTEEFAKLVDFLAIQWNFESIKHEFNEFCQAF